MGSTSSKLIIAVIAILLSAAPQNAYAFFEDEFNDEQLNTDRWNVHTNGGQVEIREGVLTIHPLQGQSYPYIYSINTIFPDGPFTSEIRLKISDPLNYGFGVNFTDSLVDNQSTSDLRWEDLIYLFWPDRSGNYKLNTVFCPLTNQSCVDDQFNGPISSDSVGDWATYKIVHTLDSAKVTKNDSLISELRLGQRRPKYIWIGNPQKTSIVTRGKVEIDYIRITHPDPVHGRNILLIPGFGASWNYQAILTGNPSGSWAIPSWINTYDNLIDSFQNAGYTKDQTLFVYPYDWRQTLDTQADMLEIYLQDLVAQNKISPDTKLDIVAHSFGGLVARSYLHKYGVSRLNKLVTVGSPHLGAAQAYKTWSGGQVLLGNWWQKAALSVLVALNAANGETPVSAIRRFSPSIQNLLPTYDYLQDQSSIQKPLSTMTARNAYLELLNQSLDPINASTSAITGNHHPTVDRITYISRNWLDQVLGKWSDGKPVSDILTSQADGVVTRTSSIGGFSDYLVTDFGHGDLVFDSAGIAAIFQKLRLDPAAIIATRSPTPGHSPIVAILRSPGALKLQTPSGSLIGMGESSTTSAIVIPDLKLVIVPQPEPGEYRIVISPDGTTGAYNLFAGQTDSNGLKLNRIDAILTDQDTDTYSLSTSSATLIPITDSEVKELLLDITSRLDPNLESQPTLKNRVHNIQAFLGETLGPYDSLSHLAQRNLLLRLLDQGLQVHRTLSPSSQNTSLLLGLLDTLKSQVLSKTYLETIDPEIYSLLHIKYAITEALSPTLISSQSAPIFEVINQIHTPTATESSNLQNDINTLLLRSVFTQKNRP